MKLRESIKALLLLVVIQMTLLSCGGQDPATTTTVPPDQNEVSGYRRPVSEVTLSDGTLCAVYWKDITCDWQQSPPR